MTPRTLSRSVTLDRGDVLRIRDGAGLTVRPASGVLWVTEERSPADCILTPGISCRLEGRGLALVYAHRAARVEIDVPARPERRPDVRLAVHGEDASTPVPLGPRRHGIVAQLRTLWRHLMRDRTRADAPRPPVGGHYAHDRFLSSRRKRGADAPRIETPGGPFDRPLLPHC
jgi:hypothetical protein